MKGRALQDRCSILEQPHSHGLKRKTWLLPSHLVKPSTLQQQLVRAKPSDKSDKEWERMNRKTGKEHFLWVSNSVFHHVANKTNDHELLKKCFLERHHKIRCSWFEFEFEVQGGTFCSRALEWFSAFGESVEQYQNCDRWWVASTLTFELLACSVEWNLMTSVTVTNSCMTKTDSQSDLATEVKLPLLRSKRRASLHLSCCSFISKCGKQVGWWSFRITK